MTKAAPGGFILAAALLIAACGGDTAAETTTTTMFVESTTSTSSTTTTVPETTTSTTVPSLGATATMYVVQGDLTALGYFDGVIDGIAGQVTTAAIASFQSDAGIEADGEFGPVTDAAISSGFTHFGRFSGYYRTMYGEAPRDTLTRAAARLATARRQLTSCPSDRVRLRRSYR